MFDKLDPLLHSELRLAVMSVLVGAYKGGLFSSTFRDCHVVSAWLKNRLK